jgi:hypothetical protein
LLLQIRGNPQSANVSEAYTFGFFEASPSGFSKSPTPQPANFSEHYNLFALLRRPTPSGFFKFFNYLVFTLGMKNSPKAFTLIVPLTKPFLISYFCLKKSSTFFHEKRFKVKTPPLVLKNETTIL